MKRTDVVVVGCGLAGIMAALAVAESGRTVRLAARGSGTLAIAGGSVDVLGYAESKPIFGDPFPYMGALSSDHPYQVVGVERVRESLAYFQRVCGKYGLPYASTPGGRNAWMPTIAGTFRPTWLTIGGHCGRSLMEEAAWICVVGISGLKDAHAHLAAGGFRQHENLRDKLMICVDLPNPLGLTHRNSTALDIARYVDTPEGERWLLASLETQAEARTGNGGVFVLPPVLGVDRTAEIQAAVERTTGMVALQMASLPPGVGGYRLERVLGRALHDAGVLVTENVNVVGAKISGRHCEALICDASDRQRELKASSFILATGGFLGGGHLATPGKAREVIFDLDLRAPEKVEDWSTPDIFANQAYSRLGVRTDRSLRPVDTAGHALLDNVRFAGRALAGYDFVTEKSGFGVALVTGRHAGLSATEASYA